MPCLQVYVHFYGNFLHLNNTTTNFELLVAIKNIQKFTGYIYMCVTTICFYIDYFGLSLKDGFRKNENGIFLDF